MTHASSWNSRSTGRRPPRDFPRPLSATSPVGRISLTTSETVDRESAARRAIAAREIRRSRQMSRSTASARGLGPFGSFRLSPFRTCSIQPSPVPSPDPCPRGGTVYLWKYTLSTMTVLTSLDEMTSCARCPYESRSKLLSGISSGDH